MGYIRVYQRRLRALVNAQMKLEERIGSAEHLR
jgi:hypothetical protein